MLNTFGLSDLATERELEIRQALELSRKARNDFEARDILVRAIDRVREGLSNITIAKLNDNEVSVTNLDEIKASLHNELNRISKPIVEALKKLSIPKDSIETIIRSIDRRNNSALDESFDIQIVRRPKQSLFVENLQDIPFPSSLSVSNFEELKENFLNLEECIKKLYNFEIPTPQVTVNPPNVVIPEIKIPEQAINLDVDSLLKALDPLKFLSDRANKPLSVRLSDGQHFLQTLRTIVDNQQKQVQAFSQGINKSDLVSALRSGINTSSIFNGGTELTPKFAKIDAASSGDNTIVAAVTGKKIRVLQLFLVSAGDVDTRFESGASGTALTGRMELIASTGYSLPFCPVGLFETATSELLNLELSGAVSVDGSLVYVEV